MSHNRTFHSWWDRGVIVTVTWRKVSCVICKWHLQTGSCRCIQPDAQHVVACQTTSQLKYNYYDDANLGVLYLIIFCATAVFFVGWSLNGLSSLREATLLPNTVHSFMLRIAMSEGTYCMSVQRVVKFTTLLYRRQCSWTNKKNWIRHSAQAITALLSFVCCIQEISSFTLA